MFRVRISRRGMYICDMHVRLTSVNYPQFRRGRKLDPTVGAVSVIMVDPLLIFSSSHFVWALSYLTGISILTSLGLACIVLILVVGLLSGTV